MSAGRGGGASGGDPAGYAGASRCGRDRPAKGRVSKREFLRSVARAAALGGIGAAGAVFAGRAAARPADDCVNRGVCPACGELEGCALPQAILARRAGRG